MEKIYKVAIHGNSASVKAFNIVESNDISITYAYKYGKKKVKTVMLDKVSISEVSFKIELCPVSVWTLDPTLIEDYKEKVIKVFANILIEQAAYYNGLAKEVLNKKNDLVNSFKVINYEE